MLKLVKYKKKILLLIMMFCMAFTLTGCDLPAELQASMETNFHGRAEQNREIAKRLYGSGIISETTFNMVVDSIQKNLDELSKDLTEDNTSMQNLLKAVVGWRIVPEEDHPVYDSKGNFLYYYHSGTSTPTTVFDARSGDKKTHQCESWAGQFLTNYLARNALSTVEDNVPAVGGNSGKINPIEVIPESLVEQINKEMSIPIYALKRNALDESGKGLDEIMEAINQASQEKDTLKAESLMALYFEEVKFKDSDGNERTATLLDQSDPEQQIVRITSQTYDVGRDFDGTIFNMTKVDAPTSNNGNRTGINFPTMEQGVGNEPGIDMVVFTAGEPIMTVRLVEFNKSAVDKLDSIIGLSENRYKVINGRAYLMEYPLGYIDGFKETDDGTAYNSVIKRSGLGFNLLTGDFTKYNKDEDGNYTNSSVVISKDDPYLTFSGALSAQDETQASIIVYGETGITGEKSASGEDIDEELNEPFDLSICTYEGEEVKSSIGRLVLRDYLEFTYAPEVVSGENIIALGRKLRILQLEGSKNNVVAQFYDKDGQKLGDDSAKLFIDDFADLIGVMENDTVKYISKQGSASGEVAGGTSSGESSTEESSTGESSTGESSTEESSTEESSTEESSTEESSTEENKELTSGMDTDNKLGTISSSASKIDNMALETVEQISCSTEFPGQYIAKSDVNLTDQKPLFYGMLVRASMFETGLFSGWVQSTDDSKNSTVWWNKWLGEHGFNYKINTDNLVNFLKGNYAWNLSQENIVILDLETISKIQQEYQAEDKLENAHFIRTMFIVFGYMLIAYAVILLIAWNVDINVDLGFNILEKLSFGKWVAVKDYEEIPFMDEGDTKFMKFGTLLVSCIFIIAVGIILIQVNIIDFVLALIQLFGGIASYISQIFTGVH